MTAIEEAREALKLDLGMRLSPGDSLYPMSARGVQRLRDALDALIAEYERLSVPPSDDEREALAELRLAAEAQRDAYARMLELGQGVGMLGVRHPEMFEAMLAWDDRSENGHADTVLDLIDRLNAALRRQESPSDDEREALAEIVARAIRAGRYSGKMVATPQPPEWHNPVDLRDGRRAVDAILASDVWRNRRQEQKR